jgi:hypothetical protein
MPAVPAAKSPAIVVSLLAGGRISELWYRQPLPV